MITDLKQLLPAIEGWPDEDQEALAEAARLIEAGRKGVYTLSAKEELAVAEGVAEADRREFAPDDEIAAIWRRFGG